MAGKIRLLTDEVIGKIAAGEVVERPAAAIKELVENSLDAGASAVTVEIRDGGISYFRVTDNGSGIEQSEIRMAFERHATSKISRAQELFSIQTLGFRGEALASIAAVGRVTCTTRTRHDASGVKVVNEGGVITSMEEAACPEGTTFVVRDLFFNTPVRLRFLKKPATEGSLVSDLMMRMILSRPDVSFRYINQGKTLYHSAGNGKLDSAVFAIYGTEMLRSMRRVEGCQGGVVLSGYVGIGESGRGNRSHQSFFINGRYMRSALLSAALEDACRERVMIGRYPVCVLHLTMPYESVDVNVHPNKLEVRFQNEQQVGDAVMAIVRDAITDRDALERPAQLLLDKEAPPQKQAVVTASQVERQLPVKVETPRPESAPRAPIPASPAMPREAPTPKAPEQPASAFLRAPAADVSGYRAPLAPPQPLAEPPRTAQPAAVPQAEQVASFLPDAPKRMKLIGTLFDTYILVEYEQSLLLIDQHAVHERLLFDRWMKLYDTQRAGQELLVPMIVTVTRSEQRLLEENRELLQRLGLYTEPLGDTEISVRTIPMLLGQPQTQDFLHDVLAQLESERGLVTLEKRRTAILQTACKHAVKGGEKLDEASIRELVTRMIEDHVTPTCPHGRPLVVALTHAELDRKFRRIQ